MHPGRAGPSAAPQWGIGGQGRDSVGSAPGGQQGTTFARSVDQDAPACSGQWGTGDHGPTKAHSTAPPQWGMGDQGRRGHCHRAVCGQCVGTVGTLLALLALPFISDAVEVNKLGQRSQ